MTDPGATVRLEHVRVELALHLLREAEGPTLLLLHGLGEATPSAVPRYLAAWPGSIWGLDFTGHGASTVPAGGGYTSEVLLGDVDTALSHLGPVTLVGRGLGAYIALLAAGGRATQVRGAILLDGPGLAGGGPVPHSPSVAPLDPALLGDHRAAPDPFALVELAKDVRPADYASTFARLATQFSGLEVPVTVAAVVRPPWLAAVVDEPGVAVDAIPAALARYAALG